MQVAGWMKIGPNVQHKIYRGFWTKLTAGNKDSLQNAVLLQGREGALNLLVVVAVVVVVVVAAAAAAAVAVAVACCCCCCCC